jgi:molybdenum-dependent DNA-binding transcriptional regulator ModE
LLRVWTVLDEMSGLPTVEATTGGTGKGREMSTRGTRLIGRSGGSSGMNKDGLLEWI